LQAPGFYIDVRIGIADELFANPIVGDGFIVTYPPDPCDIMGASCNPQRLVQSQIVRFKSNLYSYDDTQNLVGSGSLDVTLKDPTVNTYILVENTNKPIKLEMSPVNTINSMSYVMPNLTQFEYLKIQSINITKVNVTVVVQFRPLNLSTDFVLYFRCMAYPGALENEYESMIAVPQEYWLNNTYNTQNNNNSDITVNNTDSSNGIHGQFHYFGPT
jgi:hypothetical protein